MAYAPICYCSGPCSVSLVISGRCLGRRWSYAFINSLTNHTVSLVLGSSLLPDLSIQTQWRLCILDALEPLRCPSHLVAHVATDAFLPLCYSFLGLGVEGSVPPKAVLLESRVCQSFHEVVLSLFNYFPHHRGLRYGI